MRSIGMSTTTTKVAGLALSLAAATPAFAQQPTWQLTGPEGGFASEVVASSSVMLANTYGGLYRSTDQAANWQRVPAIGYAQSITASPHDPNLVVAASGTSLWRSTDGGTTWDAIAVGTRLNALQFNPIPAHGTELLAIASAEYLWWQSPRLMRSVDGGLSWQSLTADATFQPLGMAVDPRDGSYFAVLRDSRVMFSRDRGANWDVLLRNPSPQMQLPSQVLVVPGVLALLWSSDGGWVSNLLRYDNEDIDHVWGASGDILGLFADPLQSGRIWSAATVIDVNEEQLGESLDFGVTWTLVPSDRNARLQAVLADGTMIGSSLAGPLVSTDAGRHWSVRTRGIPLAQINALAGHRSNGSLIAVGKAGPWVSLDRGLTWEAGAGIAETTHISSSVDRHPRDPAIALASVTRTTAGPKVYRTTDGGLNWQPLPSDSGLFNASFLSIVYDRVDPARVSATSTSGQLFWSQDGGLHWQQVQAGVRSLRAATAGYSSRLYGLAGSDLAYTLLRADRSGEAMTPVVTAPAFGALAVHPSAPHVLLATAGGSGMVPVYWSMDGGDSWHTRGNLPGWPAPLLAFDACDDRTVYAFTSATFHRSHDRGLTWTAETLDTTVQGATAIVTSCVGGLSHVVLSSNTTGGVRVRSPVVTERIATNDFEPL